MEDYALVDHIFYVGALFGVGLWSIARLGAPGFTAEGVPCLPARWARGLSGRIVGSLLITIGAVFVFLSAAGLFRLVERLSN